MPHPHFTLQQFTGPLDLLLKLLEEEKLTITEISLSKVTEQYIAFLETVEKRSPEDLADFLVIAARLLLLKSQKLLPDTAEDPAEGDDLAAQLRLYQQFVAASRAVNQLWMSKNRSFFRVEPPRRPTTVVIPKNTTVAGIRDSMIHLITRLMPPKPLPRTIIDAAITVKDKMSLIRMLIKKKKNLSFLEILSDAANRTEVIVGFLALLELVKQEAVALRQQTVFSDITIQRV